YEYFDRARKLFELPGDEEPTPKLIISHTVQWQRDPKEGYFISPIDVGGLESIHLFEVAADGSEKVWFIGVLHWQKPPRKRKPRKKAANKNTSGKPV
ncbi:MAG: hypothetical protein OXC81_05020, partial [Betaproteobacteria bacterium]|nr:hypothetical protein [Betaproteobacteria bacterium]